MPRRRYHRHIARRDRALNMRSGPRLCALILRRQQAGSAACRRSAAKRHFFYISHGMRWVDNIFALHTSSFALLLGAQRCSTSRACAFRRRDNDDMNADKIRATARAAFHATALHYCRHAQSGDFMIDVIYKSIKPCLAAKLSASRRHFAALSPRFLEASTPRVTSLYYH